MAETAQPAGMPHLAGGPEALFRVGPVGGDAERVTMSMQSGPWMLGEDGQPAAGSIAVLVDDMFGLAVLARRPPQHWAVTTDMTIDFGAALPVDGSLLHAQSEAVSIDAGGGLGRGTVRSATGDVVAVGTQRLRFVAGTPSTPDADTTTAFDGDGRGDRSMLELLDVGIDESGTLHLHANAVHANPFGNLHGGVLLALADAAASRAVRSDEFPLRTASINVAYLRPGPSDATIDFVPTVLHRGRSLAVVQVEALRPDGKPCGLARVTAHRSTH